MSENPAPKNISWVTESPASWNTRYVTPDGFVCQLTLRGETGKDLLEMANAVLVWLRDNCYKPDENFAPRNRSNGPTTKEEAPTKTNGNGNGNGSNNGHPANWCPIHQGEMKRWEKDGKAWFSHKSDHGWCTVKSNK